MDKTGKSGNDCNHPLDALFRKGLKDHQVEPPEMIWKSINRKLLWSELLRFNFTNVPRIAWISIASGVVILSAILFLMFPDSSKPAGPVKTDSRNLAAHNYSGLQEAQQVYASKSTRVIPVHSAVPAKPEAREVAQRSEEGTSLQSKEDNVLKMIAPPVKQNLISPGKTAEISMMREIEITMVQETGSLNKNEPSSLVIHHVANISNPQEKIVTARSLTRVPIHFAAGLDIEPDITFYKTNHSYSAGSYSGSLDLQFHFGRFFLRSGVGVGYFGDVGQYLSEYQTLDSVIHTTTAVADDHYLYLQVPLMLGYKAFESDHFRFSFQAGPAVSFLMNKYEPLPEPYYPGGTVTRLTRQTPDRISTNWQIWAGFSLEYLFNRNLSISLEPTYKYGLTPVSREGELPENHSQSVGINIGFRYSFGYNYRDK